MLTHLLEGYFQLSTHHEPADKLLRLGIEIGTQRGLRFELSFRIVYQNPAQAYSELVRALTLRTIAAFLTIQNIHRIA
jgi:hypothetical protein